MKPLLFLSLLLTSCAAPCQPRTLVVDYSTKTARLGFQTFPVRVSGKGTGGRPNSNRTPIGTFTICQKNPRHRYGPILRLAGESVDGYEQENRGILIHRAYGPTTKGCIAPDLEAMQYLFAVLRVGDVVRINL